jgi:hypothetical protein
MRTRRRRIEKRRIPMSSKKAPVIKLIKFNAQPPDPAHPMPQPSDWTSPYTLNSNDGGNEYSFVFDNECDQGARIYVLVDSTSVSNAVYTGSAGYSALSSGGRFTIPKSAFEGRTNLWLGAWWDDGTYGSDRQGVINYFTAHPSGVGHHTVPILVGN